MSQHDTMWMVDAAPGGRVYVVADDDRMVCETRVEDGPELARLIAATPDMARALALAEELVNAVQQGHRVDEEFLERAHAAINGARRKAGVIS